MAKIPLTLTALLLIAGCSLPHSTVTVKTESQASSELRKALKGPDARTTIVVEGAGTLYTLVKDGESVELDFPGNKPSISISLAEARIAFSKDDLTHCKSNLKNIATALEMWSTDNEGSYPSGLGNLKPNYLSFIPTCPASDDESAYKYKLANDSLSYVITCSGQNHALAGLPDNHPKYTTMEGLVTGE